MNPNRKVNDDVPNSTGTGELVEPSEGVAYSATYRPSDDTSRSEFDPSGAHSCVFCGSPDCRWIVLIRPSEPDAKWAWAPHLVACETCQQLCRTDQLDALRERIVQQMQDWMLDCLDDLLDRIIAFSPSR